MVLGIVLLSALVGVVVGALFSALFFQTDSVWKRILIPSIIFSGSIPGIGFIFNLAKIDETLIIYSIFIYLLFAILSFVFIFRHMLHSLKNQNGLFKIQAIDIFLGYKKLREIYYKNRVDEINKSIIQIEQEKNELQKEKEIIEELRLKVEKDQENILKQINDGLFKIDLPVNKFKVIDQHFIAEMPAFFDKFINYNTNISILTAQYVADFVDYKNSKKLKRQEVHEDQEKDYLIGYLLALSMYTSNNLFDGYSVRVHFRYLDNNNIYKKLVTSFDDKGKQHDLTDIKADCENLITKSGEIKKSILKSINPEFNFSSRRKHIWYDYLTITFDKFTNNKNIPTLSMGISIKNEHFEKTLFFLNYIAIENLISDNLIQLNEKIDINKALTQINNNKTT